MVNPGRVGYFRRKILSELKLRTESLRALEVGCGGGILSEEIARMGFRTTGLDPSGPALEVARGHALESGLAIEYVPGSGERLPFRDGEFDVVFCCDVLEHVNDLGAVISEISRVLKPGGRFFFDTINRTAFSKLVAIKLWQDWKAFAFMPRNLHVWEMFIKPAELEAQLVAKGFTARDIVGLAPSTNPFAMLYYLRRRVKGTLSMKEIGERLKLVESRDKSILYVGWAEKAAK